MTKSTSNALPKEIQTRIEEEADGMPDDPRKARRQAVIQALDSLESSGDIRGWASGENHPENCWTVAYLDGSEVEYAGVQTLEDVLAVNFNLDFEMYYASASTRARQINISPDMIPGSRPWTMSMRSLDPFYGARGGWTLDYYRTFNSYLDARLFGQRWLEGESVFEIEKDIESYRI